MLDRLPTAKILGEDDGKYLIEAEVFGDGTKEKTIDGGYIYGSHDWFTWSQSFYRFVTEVAFK